VQTNRNSTEGFKAGKGSVKGGEAEEEEEEEEGEGNKKAKKSAKKIKIPAGEVGSDVPTIVEDPDAAAIFNRERDEDEDDDSGNSGPVGTSENFANTKALMPDNTDRREPLVLGKPYKLPNENDDKGFHLDAGTTFLNAYKALKPDQIAAMTKDTQELLATQKSLVSMLDSFGPLMKDMGKITGFLGPGGN
jgi:hypothetical protein